MIPGLSTTNVIAVGHINLHNARMVTPPPEPRRSLPPSTTGKAPVGGPFFFLSVATMASSVALGTSKAPGGRLGRRHRPRVILGRLGVETGHLNYQKRTGRGCLGKRNVAVVGDHWVYQQERLDVWAGF